MINTEYAGTAAALNVNFDNNERRRKILLRNGELVFTGYVLTQLATLMAQMRHLSSIRNWEIGFTTTCVLGITAVFWLITRFKRKLTTRFVIAFQFGQYVSWLVMFAFWVLTLREIRVMALFFALMPLSFMLADTKLYQSLLIAVTAFTIQILGSHYAIFSLNQVGNFALEVHYALCFAPAALFLCYLSTVFSKQRHEVKRAKRAAEESRDALVLEVERTQKANADLAQAMEKIEQLARVDALTDVFNRRHLMESLDLARKRYLRSKQPFSIVIVDIDHFKKINDTYGHLQGDNVLRGVATALKRTLRATDLCARYGGEEFMIVLEQTAGEPALQCAERLRNLVANERFVGLDTNFSATASMGVAVHHEGESIEQTIIRADAALYRAKELGRNRVELAELDTPL